MTMLTTDQITEIADDLEALANELNARDIGSAHVTAVLNGAAGNLVSVAAMRSPVPQQAYYPPPAYPYGPEDFRPGDGQSVPLHLTVTGGTRQELENRAYQAGRQVFGEVRLAVTLTGTIVRAEVIRDGVTQYQCGAIIRQEDTGPRDPGRPRHPVRDTDQLPG